ncbi:MAG: hypothetical protein WCP34_02895 [Pseudomonadota bacterium]
MKQSHGIHSSRHQTRLFKQGVAFLPLLMTLSGQSGAQELPSLWGYGTRLCEDFHKAQMEADQGIDQGILEYRRYQDWLQGFLSGLNLATGQDLLRGGEMAVLLRWVERQCDDKPEKSLLTATREALKALSGMPARPMP